LVDPHNPSQRTPHSRILNQPGVRTANARNRNDKSDLTASVVERILRTGRIGIVDGLGRLGEEVAVILSISLEECAVRIGDAEGIALLQGGGEDVAAQVERCAFARVVATFDGALDGDGGDWCCGRDDGRCLRGGDG